MKFFAILLLTAMVAITIEKCQAKYLLIQTDSKPGKGKFYLFCHILAANLKKEIMTLMQIILFYTRDLYLNFTRSAVK